MRESEKKTEEDLINEAAALRRRVRELEDEKASCVHTEKELLRLTRALKALNSCNQTLVRAKDLTGYLREICRNIIENG